MTDLGGTWSLGDRTVHRVGFGAMRLTASSREQAIGVLRRAVELGVDHIDTATFYISPLRSANELINTALAPYAGDLTITTKVGPGKDPAGAWLPMARPDQLRGQVEENLRQLGRDHLDVVNLRQMRLDSIAEHFGALAELRDAGLVRHLGLSGIKPHHLAQAQAIAPVVCVQNPYGIGFKRESDELVRLCGGQGIAFVPFFAIATTGREAGADGTDDAVVVRIAKAHNASPAQVRIAWTLHRGPHVLAIPGTGNPDHLEDNVAAADLALSDDELAELDTV